MMDAANREDGKTAVDIQLLLRWEGISLFVGMTFFYWVSDAPWIDYAIFLFVPELALLGYVVSPQIGTGIYNAVHAIIAPMCLAIFGILTAEPLAGSLAMIWMANIGLNRTFGWGLRYGAGFHFNHLGSIGCGRDTA